MKPKHSCDADRKSIAIVGFSARAAAQCAFQEGFDVVAVDMCRDRDLLSQCRTHLKLDENWPTILNDQFQGVPLLLAGGMENRRDRVDQCHAVVRRPGSTGDQIAAMRRLEHWEKWAKACELGWPTTVSNCDSAKGLLQSMSEDRWLLKSMASAGGSGTVELTHRDSANESSILKHKSSYIQKWIPGETIGITFLSCEFGTTIVGATQAWNSESGISTNKFAYRGSCGPIALPREHVLKLQHFGDLAFRESQLMGLWQADFVLNHDNLYLLEINPRWSASMDLLAYVYNMAFVDLHHACVCSSITRERFDQFSTKCMQGLLQQHDILLGKWIVYADKAFRVTEHLSNYWWENRWDSTLNRVSRDANTHSFADIPCAGTEIANGDPILTVLATGKTYQSIWHALQVAQSSSVFG